MILLEKRERSSITQAQTYCNSNNKNVYKIYTPWLEYKSIKSFIDSVERLVRDKKKIKRPTKKNLL